MKKAMIAMSGGVDSSVAAVQMIEAGYACVGATMRLHAYGAPGTCGSSADAEDAAAVAACLGMPHRVYDFSDAFSEQVIDRFVAAYERGDTPNPCIECNRHMKFAGLYEKAKEEGCEVIATGHYARVVYDEEKGRFSLRKARDLAKDQSYVLYFLSQEQLAHTRFPLGELDSKQQVRAVAQAHGLLTAHKRDSQDICFVPDGKYADFIRRYTGRDYPPGAFVNREGTVLGQHKGLIGYTVGQRRGLGLSLPAPLYVCGKNVVDNTVILSPEEALYSRRLLAENVCWTIGAPPQGPVRVTAKTRYAAKEAPAVAEMLPDGRLQVVFDQPQRAMTQGQAVVLYDGDEVLGGGTICAVPNE